MPQSTLPARAQPRIDRAHQVGYLTTTGYLGLSRWLDECRFRRWPFVLVIKDRRHWRLSVELDPWRFTPEGEQVMQHLAAEHGAEHILVGHDYLRATRLSQWAAELIASRLVYWVREKLAEQQAVTE